MHCSTDWHCDNVLKPWAARPFISKSPAGSRTSIGASQAWTILYQQHRWDQAGYCWQTCALAPHSIVAQAPGARTTASSPVDLGGDARYFLVLRCFLYAALLCLREDQWGSFPEVALLCHMWTAWAVMLTEESDGVTWTITSSVGTLREDQAPICILWRSQ